MKTHILARARIPNDLKTINKGCRWCEDRSRHRRPTKGSALMTNSKFFVPCLGDPTPLL
jgi:hypothetical protein